MRSGVRTLALALLLTACGRQEPAFTPVSHEDHQAASAAPAGEACVGDCGHHAAPTPPEPSAQLEGGARQFGDALVPMSETALADIASAPERFDGQTVHTSGTIERVCQRMGCWMELRAEGTGPIRVPMAGHSFFLPRDVAGHPAEIEGRVRVSELTEAQRAHLASEGAVATASQLSIEATSVVVR
jgi:hypothetical protein